MPNKPNKTGGDWKSTWKRIQNSDTQYDPKSWKQHGVKINRLEIRIEKMQEMFNKDLEEIKKSQLKKNNAINDIKITLEGTMRRITETEDRISEVEDKMVEMKQRGKKKKNQKKWGQPQGPLGQC